MRSCPHKNNNCLRKNLVYELKCSLCHHTYIGETKRQFHQRLKEHRVAIMQGDEKNSAFAAHYATYHQHQEIPKLPFTGKICEMAKDSADRLIREATLIRSRQPAINRDKGWNSLATKFRK